MRSRLPGLLCALCVLGGPLCSRPASAGEVVERVVADVDGRPVLLSEVRLLERLRGTDRRAALEAVIESRLMYREAARLPQAAVTDTEAHKACLSLMERTGEKAESPGSELCALAQREAAIVKYIDFRFSPHIRPTEAGDVETQLSERIEAWVRELRASARIRYNP